ncbi:hypothetical protein KSS87_017248 [Heliosperma pusillum]|nr:hypothetical protein KSS87_017248 [Heliosperma pusillum]
METLPALISSIVISLACILVVTLSWNVLNWIWFNPKRLEKILRAQGFKGNSYKLFYGDSKDKARITMEAMSKPMSDLSNDHLPRTQPFYHETVKKHGKRCFIWNGPVPMVMLPAFSASSSEMINKWEEMVSESGSCEVDAWSHLHELSANVISQAAFGSSYEEGRRLFELLTEQLKVVVSVVNQVYIPGWKYVPTKAHRKIKQLETEIKSLLMEIIKKREEDIKAGAKPKDDLLGVLLEANINKHKFGISLKQVIDECKIFFLAGEETTSTLLAWTLILLGKHQDWQQQARDEVLNTFGDDTPDFHGLNQLKTVNMILQEVLRLYPPLHELNRTVCKDIKVGDIFLPAGVLVNLSVLRVQHDESIWGSDAKEFKPDRFSQGISKATNGNMSFFSFGWGPRICIGSNFAMTEVKLALVLILQRFSFEISPSYVHAPVAISTLQPQFGAPIILKRLRH